MDLLDILRLVHRRLQTQGLSSNVDRDQRRQVLSAQDEVARLWKRKQPLQRRQQLVLMPTMWQAMTGSDVGALDTSAVHDMEGLCRGKTSEPVLTILSHAILGAHHMYGADEAYALMGIQLPLATLWIYLAARRYGMPSVFELREGLAERLVATDCHGVQPRDVRLPFPGVYVQMPPGALKLWNQTTGWHAVSLVGVAEAHVQEGPRVGRGLVSVFWCEPNEKSVAPGDDNAQVVFASLRDEWEGSVEDLERSICDGTSPPTGPMAMWQGVEYRGDDGHRLLQSFLVNFALYLSSPSPDIEPTTKGAPAWSTVIETLEQAERTQTRIRLNTGKNFSAWDVGRNTSRLRRSTSDILVRGHWRRQAHGPRWSMRRIIWIEPHVRLATGAETAGHEYEVA